METNRDGTFINYEFFRPFLWAASALGFIASVAILIYVVFNNELPVLNNRLCAWDCGWYKDIKEVGYVLHAQQQSSAAFFPLLPYLWKLLHLSVVGMSLLNAVVFCSSFAGLVKHFKIHQQEAIVFLALGLIPFFMIPYSESLFFAGGAILLWGMTKQNNLAVVFGLSVCIGSRSASMIFSVAFAILIINEWLRKQPSQRSLINLMIGLASTIIFTLMVFTVHYQQTGDFFAFFHAQKFWGHALSIPSLPLTSWHWPTHISDAAALMVGLACMFLVFQYLIPEWSFVRWSPFKISRNMNAAEAFSILYLAGTAGAILLFQGGNIHSLNRYVFATPFFLILIHLFGTGTVVFRLQLKHWLLCCVLLGTIMPRQTYLEHYIQVTLAIFFIPAGLFYLAQKPASKTIMTFSRWVPLLFASVYQLVSFSKYLEGHWMG